MSKSVMLRIRVEPEFKQKLEEAVKNGTAESMSEVIRKAVLKFLENQAGNAGKKPSAGK